MDHLNVRLTQQSVEPGHNTLAQTDLLEQVPYKIVLDYMITPLRETLKESKILDSDLKDHLKSVSTLLQLISSLQEIGDQQHMRITNACNEAFQETLVSIVGDVCFPLLYSLHLLPESDKANSEKGRALALITRLILACAEYLGGNNLVFVLTQLVIPLFSLSRGAFTLLTENKLLSMKIESYHSTETLNQFSSLELISHLLNNQNLFIRFSVNLAHILGDSEKWLVDLFHATIHASEEESAFCKAFMVVTKMFSYYPKSVRQECGQEIWQQYTQPLKMTSDGNVDSDSLWKSLYVFYCLKNYFFPLEESVKEELVFNLSSDNFWTIVQAGLVGADPSHRKLSMYLLKRLVDTCNKNKCTLNAPVAGETTSRTFSDQVPLFWWSPKYGDQLTVIWDHFFLMIETLEEKQVHVIKPLLPRMQKLLDASSITSEEGLPLLHSSWLVTIVTRCFHHDSIFMSRWGAQTLLNLDLNKVPLVKHHQLKFLSHDLLMYLQENKLYSRYEGTVLGNCSPIGQALKTFFANLFSSLTKDQKVEYLRNLLQIICDNSWGSIPMVFVFQGLSHIPADPVVGPELLQLIRQVLQTCLTFHEIVTRGATQCFACQTVINLLDLESTNLSEFFSTLSALSRDESLRRGTTLWKTVVEWLKSKPVSSKWDDNQVLALALDYLQANKEGEKSSVVVDGFKVVGLARMLVMFADVEEQRAEGNCLTSQDTMKTLESSPFGKILAEISDLLRNIRNRAYINVSKVDNCLSLLYSLALEAGKAQNSQIDLLLKKTLSAVFKEVSYFIKNRLSNDLIKADDIDEIEFYTNVLLNFGLLSDQISTEILDLVGFASRAFTASVQARCNDEVSEYDVISTSGMKVLSVVMEIMAKHTSAQLNSEHGTEIWHQINEMISVSDVPLPFTRKSSSQVCVPKAQVGRIVSWFISSKWTCQKFIFGLWLQQRKTDQSAKVLLDVDSAMEDMGIGSGSSDVTIFQALEVVMPELLIKTESADIVKLIELSWRNVIEERKNIIFWQKLRALIPMVLHKAALEQEAGSPVGRAVDQFIEQVSTMGVDKSGVMYLLFEHLCGDSLQDDPDRKRATRLIPNLVDGCFTGVLHKKGERLWLEVCAYVESLGDSCSVNQIMSSMSKNDLFTRIIILNWLSTLQPDVPADHCFVMKFLHALRVKYLDLAALTTFKQFSNSLSHRQKHRMVLVFLLLADFIQEGSSGEFLSKLWHALEIECHPSVRQNLEWLIILLIVRFPQNLASIWDVFKLYDDKRSVCLCSLFLIISIIGPKLPKQLQSQYYSQALVAVLPWTMAHHYNTRIFAQTTLTCLWKQVQTYDQLVASQYAMIQGAVEFIFKNGNASATVTKLLTNFMYSGFDPVRDYSMESIFHTMPRLACLADDEWILPRQFVQLDSKWQDDSKNPIKLRNPSCELALCKEGPWRTKAQAENEDDIVESADGDVQKKIMPWRQMSPDQETESELTSQRQKKSDEGLILVTSLVDKIPNLGGLCRTSEIFGVSEFVISNLTHVEDRMFQNLSVSAQKWITITEVMRPRIPEFLEEKRLQGYTLVGVEQTANSVCLQEYQFPKKTLLLLGNEREGIPVDIIQSLDVCVEIPQQGVIRSLNVHVCGALIVWEYTRQHMNQSKNSSPITIK